MFTYDDFMGCTEAQLVGIIEDCVHLEPEEREAFYKACNDRGLDIWEMYYQSNGV